MNKFLRKLNKNKIFLIMLAPAVVYALLFSYLPMAGIVLAFKKYTYAGGIFGSAWNGLKNFEFFFRSGKALLVSKNTVLYNLAFIILNTLTQMTVAILLVELNGKYFKKIAQSLMFLPYFISWVIVSVIAFNMLSNDFGFVNSFLVSMGFEKISFYNNGKYWPVILSIFNVWKSVGYGSVLYLAAIMGIDTEVYDAAAIDGANVFQRIFRVTIPQMAPTMVILLLLSIGGIFRGNFDMFYNLVGNNGILHPATDVIDTFTFRALITNNDFGMSAAVGLFQSVLCFVTVLVANKLVNNYDPDYSLF
ncbi:MAG: ABC transporter permease subunit [Clostridiales bacterium]|jgi:putative aldouronate transport system permease protein|nr:ABC transporter permease subunit [Clostridiales bacterium]